MAICFSAFISSSVYPNFFAISSDIFLSSASLLGVAVIPKTFVVSSWFSNNLFNASSHFSAPVLCNSSNIIKSYCFSNVSLPAFVIKLWYVANCKFLNTSAIILSLLFPDVPILPWIFSIILSFVCSNISFDGAKYSIFLSFLGYGIFSNWLFSISISSWVLPYCNISVNATYVFPPPVGNITLANLLSLKTSFVLSIATCW